MSRSIPCEVERQLRAISWQFHDAVDLLRETQQCVPFDGALAADIDRALPQIDDARQTLDNIARRTGPMYTANGILFTGGWWLWQRLVKWATRLSNDDLES